MSNDDEMVEVTVAPGRSFREVVPGGVHIARVATASRTPDGSTVYEDRVVDVQTRAVMPGETVKVYASKVLHLVKTGYILDPATGTVAGPAPTPAAGV